MIGRQLTTWLPDVVVAELTGTDANRLVRVFSVTPADPLTIVGTPAAYPMLLAVIESIPETKSVEIAFVIHPRVRVPRRVSVTVTVSSCPVVAVTVSGEARLPRSPAAGTLIDNAPVKGLTTNVKLVVVTP